MFDKEPRSELARYAFGYSDKKPGRTFWVSLTIMVVYILYKAISIHW
jgi:hypothetical protein